MVRTEGANPTYHKAKQSIQQPYSHGAGRTAVYNGYAIIKLITNTRFYAMSLFLIQTERWLRNIPTPGASSTQFSGMKAVEEASIWCGLRENVIFGRKSNPNTVQDRRLKPYDVQVCYDTEHEFLLMTYTALESIAPTSKLTKGDSFSSVADSSTKSCSLTIAIRFLARGTRSQRPHRCS